MTGPFLDSGVSVDDVRRHPLRSLHDIHIAQEQTFIEILAELRHIRRALEALDEGRSSVEVKTSTRGVDVACKAYAGSDIESAGEAAKDEYLRLIAQLNNEAIAKFIGKAS